MTGHTVRGRSVLLALGCLVVGLAAVTAGPGAAQPANETTLTVTDATVEQDRTTQVRVRLDEVPDGLSGYEVTLRLQSAGVGTVTGASYPDGYQPTTEPEIGDDGRTITLEAADVSGEVGPGATNVTLATVNVSGAGSGTTELAVTDLQVDADDGSRVEPSTDAGSLAVGTDESGESTTNEATGTTTSSGADAMATADDGSSPTGDATTESPGDAGPGFGIAAALAVLAGLAAFALRD